MTATLNPCELKAYLAPFQLGWNTSGFRANSLIFAQGDIADSVYYVLEGGVKLSAVSPQGREAIGGLCGPHQFFGEGCLSGQPRRLATAISLSDTKVLRLEAGFVRQRLQTDQKFASFFLSHLLVRVSRMEEDLLDHLFNSVEKRLARTLLRMARPAGDGSTALAPYKVNQETLAEMIGSTRTRVNFFMNKFKKLGYISYDDKLTVNNALVNVMLAD